MFDPGDLIRKRSTYDWIPINSDSPSMRNKDPLNNKHLGKLDKTNFAMVIKHHPIIKQPGFDMNDLEIISTEGIHGFVQVHHIAKVSR